MTSILTIPKNSGYNPNISVIRMLLALYVLLAHSIMWYGVYGVEVSNWLQNFNYYAGKLFQSSGETNPAVIAFITLSGYCIHRNGLRIDSMALKAFFVRRIFRIMPMLVIGTLVGGLVFYYLQDINNISAITATTKISFWGLLYKLSGLFAFIPLSYQKLAYQGNAPLVTCSVEVWLYIFYPLFLMLIAKKGEAYFLKLICGISLAGVILYTIFPSIQNWWHNASFFGFLIYWWIGVYAVEPRQELFGNIKFKLIAYILVSVLLIIYPKIFLLVEVRKVQFALLFGGLLYVLDRRTYSLKILNNQFFESGFSLYALHTPLICLALYFNINIYLCLLWAVFTAYLSYMLIERPLINCGKNLASNNNFKLIYSSTISK